MRVLRLELSHVRHFSHKRLDFVPGFNLIVGENGVGKSTVLRALLSALGRAENFKQTDRLSDDDIQHHARELGVVVELQTEEVVESVQIIRRWRQSTRRKGRPLNVPIIWFGANESLAVPLQGEKIRHYRPRHTDKYSEEERLWDHEEFLYHEEFMRPPGESGYAKFGQSEVVRRFVGEILSMFSAKFHRFVWRFIPYACLVHAPKVFSSDARKSAAFRREVQAEVMRFLDYEHPFRRYRGWEGRRSIKFTSKGYPVEEQKRIRPMPEFGEILERVSKRMKVEGDFYDATLELKLAPRISVGGPDGSLLLNQLSDGEKRIFSMIVDIARQLSRSGDGLRNIGRAPGIVVIDEIDCHLHPRWKRMIVKALEDLFPSCQFIATTHSPFIVQAVKANHLQSLGADFLPGFTDRGIDEIAFKVMRIENAEVSSRYLELLDAARNYFSMLDQAKASDGATLRELKESLRALSGRYVQNPAFQAFLEMKGESVLGLDV